MPFSSTTLLLLLKAVLLAVVVWLGVRVLLPRCTEIFARSELLFLFSASWGSVFRLFAAFGFSHEVGAH